MKSLITRQEAADLVGIHRKTLWKDIREAELPISDRVRLNNDDMKAIMELYGLDYEEALKEMRLKKTKK